MHISKLFGRKINRVFVIGIKNSPIPYPDSSTRWETYGSPLCSIFGSYFEEIAVGYFQDSKGHLDRIDVTCYKSKFKCKESEDDEVNARLFRIFNNAVKDFFKQFNAEAKIMDVHPTPVGSLIEQAAEHVRDKIKAGEDKTGLQTGKESNLEKIFESAIITTPEGKEELVSNLNIKFDPSDIREEGMTVHKSQDGRYFIGFISKASGRRRYAEVPKSEVEKWCGRIFEDN